MKFPAPDADGGATKAPLRRFVRVLVAASILALSPIGLDGSLVALAQTEAGDDATDDAGSAQTEADGSDESEADSGAASGAEAADSSGNASGSEDSSQSAEAAESASGADSSGAESGESSDTGSSVGSEGASAEGTGGGGPADGTSDSGSAESGSGNSGDTGSAGAEDGDASGSGAAENPTSAEGPASQPSQAETPQTGSTDIPQEVVETVVEASSPPSVNAPAVPAQMPATTTGGGTPAVVVTAAPAGAAPPAPAREAASDDITAPAASAPAAQAGSALSLPLDGVQPVLAPAIAGVPAAQPKAQPATARRARRIALGSGSAPSFRQREVSALGMTGQARNAMRSLGFRILSERRSRLLGNRVVARLRTPGTQSAETAIVQLRNLFPEVTFDFTHLYRPSQGAPVQVSYGADLVGFGAGACRAETRIGLIDTGLMSHDTLARAQITQRAFLDRDAATSPVHGTAIASILVGELPGVAALAPGARLYSANVFAGEAGGVRSDATAIIAALDWMASQQVRVVNLSLMGPDNALLREAVLAAAQRGQILLAAVGNDGPSAPPAYPAAYDAVIGVAAVDVRGRSYSMNNRGGYVEVAAPGVDIWGADARGGESFWTGTSFAVPFATAAIARAVAAGAVGNVNDARALIARSSRDLGAPGRDPVYGHGLLQVLGCF